MKLLSRQQAKKIIYRDKSKSYTYGLCKPNGELFYVGVGIRSRLFQHLSIFETENSGNRLKVNTINKAIENGGIKFVIFLIHSDRGSCLSLERKLIGYFGRKDNGTGILTNLTNGGEIGPTGVVVSQETKNRLSKIRREMANHLSVKNKEFWLSLTEKEKQEMLDKMHSRKADGQLLSELLIERWADPEYKKRLSEKAKVSQQLCADVHSRNMKAKWADPEYREWMLLRRKQARENKALIKLNAN